MMIGSRIGFNLSTQCSVVVSLTIFLLFTNSLSFASPIQRHDEGIKEKEFVKACCNTKDTGLKKRSFWKDVDPNDPELGALLPIYESHYYNQLIRKKYCVKKDIPEQSLCNQYTNYECNEFTQYVKQRIIVGDGWIREIWIANGCDFKTT